MWHKNESDVWRKIINSLAAKSTLSFWKIMLPKRKNIKTYSQKTVLDILHRAASLYKKASFLGLYRQKGNGGWVIGSSRFFRFRLVEHESFNWKKKMLKQCMQNYCCTLYKVRDQREMPCLTGITGFLLLPFIDGWSWYRKTIHIFDCFQGERFGQWAGARGRLWKKTHSGSEKTAEMQSYIVHCY